MSEPQGNTTNAAAPPRSGSGATDRGRARKMHLSARIAVTMVFIAVAAVLGVSAFRFYEDTAWTRDGRVSAYVVDSAPEIAGMVVEVPIHDNQLVHAGDLLYRIDPRDYEAALRHAKAELDATTTRLALERENFHRREKLRTGDVSAEERARYATGVQSLEADVEAAEAALYKAAVDLERCEVRSPVNGWVTNLTVRVGNYADIGERQVSVIDADSFWITGYFEETRLRHIRIGAEARIVLMGYPDLVLTGHVESINRGIADLNLEPNRQGLPQVDPVFTWVRLAQRIPVRIHIDHVPEGVHLAIGETCTISVETPE